jgi:DNA-binding response OmpR family regulator
MPSFAPHILVIDDNAEILSIISLILNKRNYVISAMQKLENFTESVEKLSPDLILLDNNLGWADGCTLCKSLKENNRLSVIPVVMFSAYYKKREACITAGADDFLEKPFKMQSLLDIVGSFFNRERLQ